MPALQEIAWLFILIALLCALIVVADLCLRPPQPIWVMNLVWPVTALYAGPFGLILYCCLGRMSAQGSRAAVVHRTLYCGAGCITGYLVAEGLLPFIPFTVAGSALYGRWTLEMICAFVIGILFQYVAIRAMEAAGPAARLMGFWRTLLAALKADTLPLIAWQVGMYGGMAIATFLVFKHPLSPLDPVFWWIMQMAMVLGFWTAYPVNILLPRNAYICPTTARQT